MPVTGRKPKPDGQKRNRRKPTYEWVEVVDTLFDGKPPTLPRDVGWPAATKRWWKAVSKMPHCVLWSQSDWQFALDTALVAKAFHEGDTKVATELRQREKVLGTTVDARRDLRIRYISEDSAAGGLSDGSNVTAMDEYRAMLDDD